MKLKYILKIYLNNIINKRYKKIEMAENSIKNVEEIKYDSLNKRNINQNNRYSDLNNIKPKFINNQKDLNFDILKRKHYEKIMTYMTEKLLI